MGLPRRRSNAYVRAIVEREAHAVATAQTGTRHHSLLKAARTLGRLVGGDELVEDDARAALLDAAAGHVGVDACTAAEVEQTIADGIGFGRQLPRRITDAPRASHPRSTSGDHRAPSGLREQAEKPLALRTILKIGRSAACQSRLLDPQVEELEVPSVVDLGLQSVAGRPRR